ncbi:hypothetical protein HBE96_07650 [Clostridium sp. P21]|uniref:Nudix hydrolase domain-containing protein n=1 Tax=Clostridium muellerianum TaxID=2716538 RepID=A0A7Y0HNE3_9CLOT|nr:hypothetical protein [Clostridium muellerianum]NMM62567.1 hypothetical protein [Clostridium muellerianum]
MKEINIYKFDNNVKVHYTKNKVSLHQEYRDNMEIYWKSLLKSGKKFFRGDVFTITNINYHEQSIDIYVELTDYAHFLYTLDRGMFDEKDCRVIYTSVLIETCDGKFVIGEMNRDTFAPKKLQFVGGGIDKDDIDGDLLDLEHNIRKEIFEELGLDTYDKNITKDFRPYFLKDGGKSNFLSAVFKLDLFLNEVELVDRFHKFSEELISQGISPELNSLILIKAEQKSVENFINNDLREKDENLIPILKAAIGLYNIKNLY